MGRGCRRAVVVWLCGLAAGSAQAACTDSCGDMSEELKADMNQIACMGLSNYPTKELDACRKGFHVAKNMGCYFVCEAKDEGAPLAPSGDGVSTASRTAACKAVGAAAADTGVAASLVKLCYDGYDWSLAQYIAANPSQKVKDGFKMDPNAWTYLFAIANDAPSQVLKFHKCAQGDGLAPALVNCVKAIKPAMKWVGPRKLIGGVDVPLNPGMVSKSCVVLSIGLEKDLAFERALLNETACKVYMFDPRPNAVPTVHHSGRQTFDEIGIAAAKDAASLTTTETRDVDYDTLPAKYQSFADALVKHKLKAEDISLVKLDTGGHARDVILEVLDAGIPHVLVHIYGSDTRRFMSTMAKVWNRGYTITQELQSEVRSYDWQELGSIATYTKGYRIGLELFKSPHHLVADEPAAMRPANKLVTAAVVKQAMLKLGNSMMLPGVA